MADRIGPVEVTTRYVTSVPDLASAWAFVMDRIDAVGPDPSIEIKPVWIMSVHEIGNDDIGRAPRQFSVVVEGMVEEPEESRG